MRKTFLNMLVVMLSLAISCSLAFAGDNAVLARIGGKTITVSDLNRIIGYYSPEKQETLQQHPEYRATILKRLVQAMVLSKIARDNKFDDRKDIKEQLDLQTDDLLATEYLQQEVLKGIKVTDDDALIYYKAHPDKFTTPETVTLSQIMVKVPPTASAEEKEKGRAKAEEILNKAKAGENFAKLASEMSDDSTTRLKGGLLGTFVVGKMIPEFNKAVASLKPGELSGVVQTQFGYHVIKVDERRKATTEPFDKMKTQAREMVLDEFKASQAEKFMDKAFKEANVQIYPDRLPTPEKKADAISK